MRTLTGFTALGPLVLLGAAGCGTEGRTAVSSPRVAVTAPFVERAAELGLDFVQFNGMSGEYYFCEHMGSGAALLDHDGDGDLDLYVVQGAMLPPGRDPASATFPPEGPLGDRLFRNRLVESGRLGFEDVTEESGIHSAGYGMGATTGDYDRDGRVDLYVTRFGSNALLRNRGDGTFEDVTQASGTDDPRWSTSAAFLDYDADGWQDLFVAHYVDFTLENHKRCYSASSARDYCGPLSYEPVPDKLFRNRGDGTFEDVTASSQVARVYGAGLGVVWAEYDGDGRVDVYVANDTHPNQLWVNQGDGTFRDTALLGGCALNEDGKAEASMGVDSADYDEDGDEDLFMTHLTDETNTLYRNDGTGLFEDVTDEAALGVASRAYTGFGTSWIDYDNDGWLDLLVVNGAAETIEARARAGDVYPLDQSDQLFRNMGDGTFEDVSGAAGEAFRHLAVSRGAAFGDLDNDGDTDVVVIDNSGRARLLINEVGALRPWLGLRLVDDRGDVLGARAVAELDDGRRLHRRTHVAASYLSANDPRVLFGLGTASTVRRLTVQWPNGARERFGDLEPRRYTTLRRGSGEAVP